MYWCCTVRNLTGGLIMGKDSCGAIQE